MPLLARKMESWCRTKREVELDAFSSRGHNSVMWLVTSSPPCTALYPPSSAMQSPRGFVPFVFTFRGSQSDREGKSTNSSFAFAGPVPLRLS